MFRNSHYLVWGRPRTFPALSKEEKDILDVVIGKLGKKSKNDIVNFMHKEQAYVETAQRLYRSNMRKAWKSRHAKNL